jgi:hypothetical protein
VLAHDVLLDVLFRCTADALRLDAQRRAELRDGFSSVNLVAIGLESLAGVELCRLLRVECGVDLPLQDLLGPATVGELVDLLHAQQTLARLRTSSSQEAEEWLL